MLEGGPDEATQDLGCTSGSGSRSIFVITRPTRPEDCSFADLGEQHQLYAIQQPRYVFGPLFLPLPTDL